MKTKEIVLWKLNDTEEYERYSVSVPIQWEKQYGKEKALEMTLMKKDGFISVSHKHKTVRFSNQFKYRKVRLEDEKKGGYVKPKGSVYVNNLQTDKVKDKNNSFMEKDYLFNPILHQKKKKMRYQVRDTKGNNESVNIPIYYKLSEVNDLFNSRYRVLEINHDKHYVKVLSVRDDPDQGYAKVFNCNMKIKDLHKSSKASNKYKYHNDDRYSSIF